MRIITAVLLSLLLWDVAPAADVYTGNWSSVHYDYAGLETAHAVPHGPFSWNTGQIWINRPVGTDVGFAPDWCLANGVVPSFEIFSQFEQPVNSGGANGRYGDYYAFIDQVAAQDMPLSFVGSQDVADVFRTWTGGPWDTAVVTDPEDSHPYRITLVNGTKTINKKVSVFSPGIKCWYELGSKYGQWLAQFQPRYPTPPLILLRDNNEAGIGKIDDQLTDYRCPAYLKTAIAGLTAEERGNMVRRRIEAGMMRRWAEFRRGLLDQLSPEWASVVRFIGYGSFSQECFKGGQISANEFPFASSAIGHDGVASSVGYMQYPKIYQVRSPMTNACNLRWGQAEFNRQNGGDFYVETLFAPMDCDDAGFLGHARGTVWIAQPQSVGLYAGSTGTVAEFGHWMEHLTTILTEIRDNETLNRFYTQGTLLQNRWRQAGLAIGKDGFGHPYNGQENKALPPEYSASTLADRWFIQNVSSTPRVVAGRDVWCNPLSHEAPVNCFAICFELDGEYLVYAHAPRGARTAERIDVCPDGATPRFSITVDVPVEGRFWTVVNGQAIEVE